MPSTKKEIDDFLRSYPNCKSFLYDFMKRKKEELKNEIKKDKMTNLVEKAKSLIEYDVTNFKKSDLPQFKYKLELLQSDDSDFKVLEKSFNLDDQTRRSWFYRQNTHLLNEKDTNNIIKIYRVIPTDSTTTTTESRNSSGSKVLLLHGTNGPNVEEILKAGFKPKKFGFLGHGVYLTDSLKYAYKYGKCFVQEQGMAKKLRYFFVNQVNQTDVQTPTNCLEKSSFQDYLKNKPVINVFDGYSAKPANFEDSSQTVFDSRNNKILQGSFVKTHTNQKIVVAHHDIVTPVYLIEINEKRSAKEIASEILYWDLGIERFVDVPSTIHHKFYPENKKIRLFNKVIFKSKKIKDMTSKYVRKNSRNK